MQEKSDDQQPTDVSDAVKESQQPVADSNTYVVEREGDSTANDTSDEAPRSVADRIRKLINQGVLRDSESLESHLTSRNQQPISLDQLLLVREESKSSEEWFNEGLKAVDGLTRWHCLWRALRQNEQKLATDGSGLPSSHYLELIANLALLYQDYGALSAERHFLEELYEAKVLGPGMRLRFTYLLAIGDTADRERAVEMILRESLPEARWIDYPGQPNPREAVESALGQLDLMRRPAELLIYLTRNLHFLDPSSDLSPATINFVANAVRATKKDEQQLIEWEYGIDLIAWWQSFFDETLEYAPLDGRGVEHLVRSAALLSDRERVWTVIRAALAKNRSFLVGVDEMLTEFGLLAERAACRIILSVGTEDYERVAEEGQQLIKYGLGETNVRSVTSAAMLDAADILTTQLHLQTEREIILNNVRPLIESLQAEGNETLRIRLEYLSGDYEAALDIAHASGYDILPISVTQDCVNCWYEARAQSLEGTLDDSVFDVLPKFITDSGLAALVIDRAIKDGQLELIPGDGDSTLELSSRLISATEKIQATDVFVQVAWHLGHILVAMGDVESSNGRGSCANKLYEYALSVWQDAIARSIRRVMPFTLLLERKHRLWREQIEIDYRRQTRRMRDESDVNPDAIMHRDQGAGFNCEGKFEQAITEYTHAIELDPGRHFDHRLRGDAYMGIKAYDKAEADYSEAIRLAPDAILNHVHRARLRLRRGNYDDAKSDFEVAIARQPSSPQLYYECADVERKLGEFDLAVERLKTAVKLRPNNVDFLNSLGYSLASCPDDRIRDGATAIQHAKRACDESAWQEWMPVSTLSAAYAATGDFERAIHFGGLASEISNDNAQQKANVETVRSGGAIFDPSFEEAISRCKSTLESRAAEGDNTGRFDLWLRIGYLHCHSPDPDWAGAVEAYTSASEAAGQDAESRLGMHWCDLASHIRVNVRPSWDAALLAAEKAVEIFRSADNASWLRHSLTTLAFVLEESPSIKVGESSRVWRELVESFPDYASAHIGLILQLDLTGAFDEADQVAKQVRTKYEDETFEDSESLKHRRCAFLSLREGRYDDVIEQCALIEAVETAVGDFEQGRLLTSLAHFALGNVDEARAQAANSKATTQLKYWIQSIIDGHFRRYRHLSKSDYSEIIERS